MKHLQTAFIFIGIYLMFEGIASFITFADQDPLFQAGRILRVFFGAFIIYYSSKISD